MKENVNKATQNQSKTSQPGQAQQSQDNINRKDQMNANKQREHIQPQQGDPSLND